MAKLNVNCLGTFRASLDGIPLTSFDTDKTRALLVYLLVEGDRPHRREFLAGLLWSDIPEDRALHNLRQSLSALRKVLGEDGHDEPFLNVQRDCVQRNPHGETWLDIDAFEQDTHQALAWYHPQPGQPGRRLNVRRLQAAVALFEGPFLDQIYLSGSPLFDEWASLKREETSQRMIEALTILADLYEKQGDQAAARRYAGILVGLVPWDEIARMRLMRLLACGGEWSAAIAQYRQLRRYLKDELDVEPSHEAKGLFETIRALSAKGQPMPAKYPPSGQEFPSGVGRFIGRKGELDGLADALADPHCRWLTILGPGGIGKTRLAVETARQQVGVFADGIQYFSLTTVTSEGQLQTILQEGMGLAVQDGAAGRDTLIDFLGGKQTLWVLDNLEQLLPCTAGCLLSEILEKAAGVVILATSRQRVHLAEEHVFLLEGLIYPQEKEPPDWDTHTALGLFASRASQVLHRFKVDDDANRQSAAAICRLVEGLPLGVELAAAALWGCTPGEILSRLQDSLGSLESPAANVTGRHRSLGAAFEVSWNLLSPAEQRLLSGLSVFRDGFDVAMVLGVFVSTAGQLSALVDKSLLRQDGAGRYDLHEAVRQFAALKLALDPGIEQETLAQHAGLYAGFLVDQTPRLKGPEQQLALEQAAREWSNVRQAWQWLASSRSEDHLAACAEAVFHFCNIRSRYSEGIELFRQAVDRLEQGEQGALALPRCLVYMGALAFRASENNLAQVCLDRAESMLDATGSPLDLAICLVFAAGLASRKKDRTHARLSAQRALDLFQAAADPWGESYALYMLGLLESRAGQFGATEEYLQASLAAARRSGDQRRQIAPLNVLGDLACQKGDFIRARDYFEQSLALSQVLQDRFNISMTLLNLGTTAHILGNLDEARRCYLGSLEVCREMGDLAGESIALANLGELALVQNRFREGLEYCTRGLALAEKVDDPWSLTVCHLNLGDAGLGLGDRAFAGRHLFEALMLSRQMQQPPLMLRVLLFMGRWYLLHGNRSRAGMILDLVTRHPSTEDEHRSMAGEIIARESLQAGGAGEATLEGVTEEELLHRPAPPDFNPTLI